jgi:hypothetical protein
MAAGSTYTPISTYTVTGSTSFTAINLTSIPQTYTDLILVIVGSNTASGYSDNLIRMRPNSDSSSTYSSTYLTGDGSSATSTRRSGNSIFYLGDIGTVPSTNIFQFNNYSNTTTYKTILSRTSNTDAMSRVSVGLWQSTSAISSIYIDLNASSGNDWSVGSTFTLYGILAA